MLFSKVCKQNNDNVFTLTAKIWRIKRNMYFIVWVAGPLCTASQTEVSHISNIPCDKVYVNRC